MIQNKKILIIEDEKAMIRPLKFELEKIGFEVENVFNGEEALEILLKKKIDFIILDLVMPKMDGFKFLMEMRKGGVNVPIAVISNLSQEEDFKRAKALGARDYFVKSNITVAGMIEYIKKALEL